jgi:hypothetical protein
MYTPKPVNFSIVRQKKDNKVSQKKDNYKWYSVAHNWYSVVMEHNGNYYILKEYSKSKARAMEYIRKIRTGSYKTIPTQSLENA